MCWRGGRVAGFLLESKLLYYEEEPLPSPLSSREGEEELGKGRKQQVETWEGLELSERDSQLDFRSISTLCSNPEATRWRCREVCIGVAKGGEERE